MTRRCLVVDDHDGFRATARRMLEADGWTVVGEASDGTSALVAAEALRPDVALVDVGLPDIDGFAVADGLAAEAIRVVLISSRDRTTYGDRLATRPAVAFIAKADLDGPSLRALLDATARR